LAFWHFGKLVDGQPAKMPTEQTCRQATALSSGGTAGMTNDFGFGILAFWQVGSWCDLLFCKCITNELLIN
jgi:hypothetical protein